MELNDVENPWYWYQIFSGIILLAAVIATRASRLLMKRLMKRDAETLNFRIDDPKVCEYVEMGNSYDSDVDLAMKIMREEALKHPSYIDNRTPQERAEGVPTVRVRLIGFGDSSVNLRAYVWVNDPVSGFLLRFDLYKSIKKRFDEEGIEIPFPYRTLVFKNPKDKEHFRGED